MTPQPHDFRKPPPLPASARAQLTRWTPRIAQAVAKQLKSQVSFDVEIESAGLEVLTADELLTPLPETTMRFRAGVADTADVSLLLLPRAAVLAVIGSILGDAGEDATADRELTGIEAEIAEFVARECFSEPIQRSWTGSPPLALEPATTPARAAYPPGTLLIVAPFRIRGPFGDLPWWWALPRGAWIDRLAGAANLTAPVTVPSAAERERAVCDLPLRLTVELGAASLSLIHLAGLAEGDVLLLEQPVDEPLTASFGTQGKYRVWPGAVGTRQAVSIHSPIES